MKLPYRYILPVVFVSVCSSSPALGASVTVSSSGSGGFVVQGDDTKGIYGIELTIGYETSVQSAPKVTWGSLVADADIHMANTTVPGSIRVAIIKAEPFTQNNGPIAAITFATQNSSCGISSVSAKIIDSASAHIPVAASIAAGVACAAVSDPVLITTPGVPFSQPIPSGGTPTATTTLPTATTATTATSPVPMVPGTVAFPAETQPGKAEKTVESKVTGSPEPAETAEAVSQQSKPPMPEKAVETAEPVSVRQTVYSGILERFQAYQGEKTPANLIDLFTKAVSTSIHQNPSVAISDGTTTVRVVVDHSAVTGTSTNFALSGAKLVSLKNDVDSGVWVLEILPSANALQATVTIVNSNSITTFPLTVVPPIGTASVSRADFDAFIKDGGSRVPKYDLNGDGSHNYLDDYIYTAHYLIAQSTAATTAK